MSGRSKRAGLRNTRQRQMVLDVMKEGLNHPSADEVYLKAREKDDRISRGTVYRNLRILTETGDLMLVRTRSADRYDITTSKHCHFICMECDRVFDAPIPYHEEYDMEVEKVTGYKIERHRTIFEGYCSDCMKKKAEES